LFQQISEKGNVLLNRIVYSLIKTEDNTIKLTKNLG